MSLYLEAKNPRWIIVALAALALAFTACKKPEEVGPNQAMTQGDAAVTVTGVELVRLDLETSSGPVALRKPALRVDVKVSAVGETAVHWDPGFSAGGATQARNVLLFAANTWKDGLSSSNNLSALSTEKYVYLDDPITEAVDIAPGETIEDVLLFEAPSSGTKNLVLSIPPRVFGQEAKLPGYISIPFSANTPDERAVATLGEAYEAREFTFKVTKSDVLYQRLKQADGKDAVSRDPLLRIDFEVTNTSEQAIEYLPTMLSGGVDFPALVDQRDSLQNRATFREDVDVVGQLRQRTTIAPGKTIKDFILFDRPTRGVEELRLFYPGKRLGGTGLVEIQLPYTWKNPELPKEFQPK